MVVVTTASQAGMPEAAHCAAANRASPPANARMRNSPRRQLFRRKPVRKVGVRGAHAHSRRERHAQKRRRKNTVAAAHVVKDTAEQLWRLPCHAFARSRTSGVRAGGNGVPRLLSCPSLRASCAPRPPGECAHMKTRRKEDGSTNSNDLLPYDLRAPPEPGPASLSAAARTHGSSHRLVGRPSFRRPQQGRWRRPDDTEKLRAQVGDTAPLGPALGVAGATTASAEWAAARFSGPSFPGHGGDVEVLSCGCTSGSRHSIACCTGRERGIASRWTGVQSCPRCWACLDDWDHRFWRCPATKEQWGVQQPAVAGQAWLKGVLPLVWAWTKRRLPQVLPRTRKTAVKGVKLRRCRDGPPHKIGRRAAASNDAEYQRKVSGAYARQPACDRRLPAPDLNANSCCGRAHGMPMQELQVVHRAERGVPTHNDPQHQRSSPPAARLSQPNAARGAARHAPQRFVMT